MTDDVLHASLIALFVALVASSGVAYRDSAAERLAARRADRLSHVVVARAEAQSACAVDGRSCS